MFPISTSENARESFVSTTLCLYNKTSSRANPKKRNRVDTDDPEFSCRQSDNNLKKIETKTRYLSAEEKAEEVKYGVSTELTLMTDPWIIKKILTTSDLGQSNRLLLIKANPIEDHILKYLTRDDENKVKDGEGVKVNMYDHDTHTNHEVVFKKWTTWGSYILNGGWRKDFVRRRDLRKGDQVGIFWDRFDRSLHFRVLSRAAPT